MFRYQVIDLWSVDALIALTAMIFCIVALVLIKPCLPRAK